MEQFCVLLGVRKGSMFAEQSSGPFSCDRGPWAHGGGGSQIRAALLCPTRLKYLGFPLLGCWREVRGHLVGPLGRGGDGCEMPREGPQELTCSGFYPRTLRFCSKVFPREKGVLVSHRRHTKNLCSQQSHP